MPYAVVEFQKGETMYVADCTSRNPIDIGIVQIGDGHYELALTDDLTTREADPYGLEMLLEEMERAELKVFDASPAAIREHGGALAPQELSFDEIRQEQKDDAYAQEIRARLALTPPDPKTVKEFEEVGGLLYHFSDLNDAELDFHKGGRVYMPKSLRPRVMHNYHNSIYGTHRCANSTLHDIRQRFWWPGMRRAVRQHVRHCRECQLAKGGEPHHHGRPAHAHRDRRAGRGRLEEVLCVTG